MTVSVTLVILSIIGQFTVYFLPDFPLRDGLSEEFNVTTEGNFPTLYSAILLFFCACLLSVISYIKKNRRERYYFHWKALSLIFFYLSLDEGISLHEHITEPLRKLGFSGFLYNAWIIPAAFILIILGLVFFRFVLHLPKLTKRLFILGGFIYVFGAFGVELIDGAYRYVNGSENFTYQIIVSVEEFLEMAGVIIFIHALLSYLIRLKVDSFGLDIHLKMDQSRR